MSILVLALQCASVVCEAGASLSCDLPGSVECVRIRACAVSFLSVGYDSITAGPPSSRLFAGKGWDNQTLDDS